MRAMHGPRSAALRGWAGASEALQDATPLGQGLRGPFLASGACVRSKAGCQPPMRRVLLKPTECAASCRCAATATHLQRVHAVGHHGADGERDQAWSASQGHKRGKARQQGQ